MVLTGRIDVERKRLSAYVLRWRSRAPPTVAALERRLAADGLTPYDTFDFSKGWSIGGHSHDRLEVRALVKGKLEFRFGRRRLTVRPGDILYIPARAGHSARALAASRAVAAYKEEFVSARGQI